MKFYTGIGSRKTPRDICYKITLLAKLIDKAGFTLRSGHADGADMAFENGSTSKHIYLPKKKFNGATVDNKVYFGGSEDAYMIAENIHPAWDRCNQFAKDAHARNVHQVLGHDLKTPSKFLICWTEDGKTSGGSATAIRLATAYKIPVYNLGSTTFKEVLSSIGI